MSIWKQIPKLAAALGLAFALAGCGVNNIPTKDQNVNQNGVYQSFLAAKPAYAFLNVPDKIGIGFADRPHGMVQGDWDSLLPFGDKYLMNKSTDKKFDYFPPDLIVTIKK